MGDLPAKHPGLKDIGKIAMWPLPTSDTEEEDEEEDTIVPELKEWSEQKDPKSGKAYYFNAKTKRATW